MKIKYNTVTHGHSPICKAHYGISCQGIEKEQKSKRILKIGWNHWIIVLATALNAVKDEHSSICT